MALELLLKLLLHLEKSLSEVHVVRSILNDKTFIAAKILQLLLHIRLSLFQGRLLSDNLAIDE